MAKISNEFKAGLMILICIVALGALTFKIGNFDMFREGYALNVEFNFASGIKTNSPVQLAGVEVGTVKDIDIVYGPEGTKVVLNIWLDSSAKVREDSDIYISTMGLMGEKYIEITRGSKEGAFVQPDSLLVGKDPIIMEEVMDKAVAITDSIEKEVGLLIDLTRNVDSTLKENKEDIGVIVDNLKGTTQNFKEFSEDIKQHPWKLIIKSKPKKKRKPRRKKTREDSNFLR